MTVQNDVVWTKVEIPAKPNSTTPGVEEEAPLRVADLAIKPEKAPAGLSTPGVADPEEDMAARLELALKRVKRTYTPPDIVRLNRPSLLRVIAYTWRGDWGPKTGVWRTLGQLDAIFLAIPGVAFFYSCAWVWERPARRFAASLLTGAIVWLLKSLGWV